MRQGLVKYNNELAGILTEDAGEYQFVYNEKYIQKYPDQFITFQMPVSSQPYKSKRLFPFFDGLIPEGKNISLIVIRNDKKNVKMSVTEHVTANGELKGVALKVYTLGELKNELTKLN